MNGLDLVILTVVGLSVLAGLIRGFIRESLSLAAWVVAFLGAKSLAPLVAPLIPVVESESIRLVVALVLAFVLILVVAGLSIKILTGLVKWAGLGAYDKLLGGFFGALRALLLVALGTLVAGLTALPKTDTWLKSVSHPYLESVALRLKPWLPDDLATHIQYSES